MNKIVIASVLKPVDDVRSYWKIAQSLAKTNKYEVNIIGIEGKKQVPADNIHFHSHRLLRNQWAKRLLTRALIFWKVLMIKPSILIISTHELVNAAILLKLLTGCKLVYDVQENHALNIQLKRSFPRTFYSNIIKLKERWARAMFDQFWLAEKCYQDELDFPEEKSIVIENKAYSFEHKPRMKELIRVIFSGTISEYSGAKQAMKTMQLISRENESTEGLFIGQIHDPNLEKWLENETKMFPNIQLKISKTPVAHPEILDGISWANLGIISYQENPVNRNKIPTKLYEYSRYQLPFLVQENTQWASLGKKLGAPIPVDFENPDLSQLKDELTKQLDNLPDTYPEHATWEYEEVKIISSINSYFE